jgi:hypothetical protein
VGPIWLADCLAGVMILTALYCCRRLVRSFPGSVAQRDVDVWHVVMGVVMAGMFMTRLAFGPSSLWVIVFGTGTVWFGWGALRDAVASRGASTALVRQLGHVASGIAMVVMVTIGVASNASAAGTPMRGMVMGGGPALGWKYPVAVSLAAFLLTYALWSLTTLAPVLVRAAGSLRSERRAGRAPEVSPPLAQCCEVIMALTMSYMLILLA